MSRLQTRLHWPAALLLIAFGRLCTASSWSPSGYVEKKAMSEPCVVFGNTFSLDTVMVKHLFIQHGVKCTAVDVDTFKKKHRKEITKTVKLLASVNEDIDTDSLPMVFVGGNPIGGASDVQALLHQPTSAAQKKVMNLFVKAGAMMLSCDEQKAYTINRHQPKALSTPVVNQAMDEQAYLKDVLSSTHCVVFANTWCANDEKDAIDDSCTPYSAELENGLMNLGAQCKVIDLFKEKMNKGFFRVMSKDSLQSTDFSFEQAHFGTPLPPQTMFQIVNAHPSNACTPLQNAESVADRVVLVQRGKCSFSKKMAMMQKAGAAGMVLMNNDDTLVVMKGGKKTPKFNLWGISVKESSGLKLQQAISAGKHNRAVVSVERGGGAEKALKKISGESKLQLPMLYLDSNKIVGVEDVKGKKSKDAWGMAALKTKLQSSGAFMHAQGCQTSHLRGDVAISHKGQ
jgi:glutaredoxin